MCRDDFSLCFLRLSVGNITENWLNRFVTSDLWFWLKFSGVYAGNNTVIGIDWSRIDILLNVFLAIAVDNLADADALGENDAKDEEAVDPDADDVVYEVFVCIQFLSRTEYFEFCRLLYESLFTVKLVQEKNQP